MNILFISELYPHYSDQPLKEMTRALHYFVQDWLTHSDVFIKVIIPLNRFRLRKRSFNLKGIEREFIDNVEVIRIPLWNL